MQNNKNDSTSNQVFFLYKVNEQLTEKKHYPNEEKQNIVSQVFLLNIIIPEKW